MAKLNVLEKIRVGAVNYLNTKPLLYGIRDHSVMNDIDIIEDYPARIADMLLNDEIDVGLVPVATILRMKEWYLVGNYGIGCDGPVASVAIFSEVPIENVKTLYLDYQSRTSARLAQILIRDHWKIDPEIIEAKTEDFRKEIKNETAALIIGDRALEQISRSSYMYDLGEAWKQHTGLPFVFAAWISSKPMPEDFVIAFDDANAQGAARAEAFGAEMAFEEYDMLTYFIENIRFRLTAEAKDGLKSFLEKKL